ncbi:ABC transporter permease [Henriciella marina]|uniref:ABC transporter permease n=1 Tax=Henriciella marina TaxID=453851 RepID=UPI0003687E45|nr:ABC transporter permease [Henriciella marina]
MSDEISAAARPLPAPPRNYGAINWIGLSTLYQREVGRFLKVWMQTLFAPVITTLLFMTVFKLAFGNRGELTGDFSGLDYNSFLAPGLIIMSMLQNAFQNTSSSLTIAKVQGSQVDFLMPPLSPLELTLGFIFGAVTRGLMVGIVGGLAIHFSGLASLNIAMVWPLIWFSLMATIFLAALGAIAGIWAEKFDHLAAITNFVIVPLTFLSGTFYDIKVLVEPFQTAAHFDPIFYLIDGFRAGFIGVSNTSLATGAAVSAGFTFVAVFWVWWLFRTGYKLKS